MNETRHDLKNGGFQTSWSLEGVEGCFLDVRTEFDIV